MFFKIAEERLKKAEDFIKKELGETIVFSKEQRESLLLFFEFKPKRYNIVGFYYDFSQPLFREVLTPLLFNNKTFEYKTISWEGKMNKVSFIPINIKNAKGYIKYKKEKEEEKK